MKKFFALFGFLFVAALAIAQTGPKMEFAAQEVQYGTIVQDSEPYRELAFTNTGDAPLVIKGAKGSCGCTVPEFPKEMIMPGETSKIRVRYATNRVGNINKTVTITTNEKGNNKHVLKVVGKVTPKKKEAPATPGKEKDIFSPGK